MEMEAKKVEIRRYLIYLVILLFVSFSLISCSRPPEDVIFKDFMSIVKINPNTGGPRVEWEQCKAAGYEISRIYKEDKRTIVVLKLNKPYYGRRTLLMFYEKLPDGSWKWKGWNMKKG